MKKVDRSSQVYLTIEHKRGASKPRFSFSVVAKTILISATILATLTSNVPNAYAASILQQQNVTMATSSVQSTSFYNRLAGENRYDTAVAIAQDGWTQSDYAILAFGENFPDALAASPLAAKYNAPILLTEKDTIPLHTKHLLGNLKVKHVFIAGGTGVVSNNVDSELQAMSIEVTRVAGISRYDTSVKIAEYLGNNVDTIFIVNGDGYADALSVAGIAGKLGAPILLVQKNSIPESVSSYIASHNIKKSFVIGGTGVISGSVFSELPNPERLSGNSRYDTNIAVLNRFESHFNTDVVAVATGEGFADALAGAPLSAKQSIPVVLLPNDANPLTQAYISNKTQNLNKTVIFGGEAVVKSTHVDNYMKGTTVTQPQQSTITNETELISQLDTAANLLKTLYATKSLSAVALNQLATRLVEIENRLNDSSFRPSQNLANTIMKVDSIVSGINISDFTLSKATGSEESYNKVKTTLTSIKGKMGLVSQTTPSKPDTSSTPTTGNNVIYAGPTTKALSGQPISLTPVPGYNKITVRYGFHSYGTESQVQYNAVMQAVDYAKNATTRDEIDNDDFMKRIKAYKNGTASTKDSQWVQSNYDSHILSLPEEELYRLFSAFIADGKASDYAGGLKGNTGASAYTAIFDESGATCLGTSYVTQAAFDAYGFNTRILGVPSHAWCSVEINGIWYNMDGLREEYGTSQVMVPATFSGQY